MNGLSNVKSQTTPVDGIFEEQSRRTIRSTPVPIITLNSTRGGKALAASIPGSVHVVLARKGSGVLERVREALKSGDESFQLAIEEIRKPLARRKPLTSLEAMAKLIVKQPVFAELRSGGEKLHSGLIVPPGADAISSIYPYNGGPLPSRGLELVEYVADGAGDTALEAIALRSDPTLTKAEAAALKLMPKDQIARNIGQSFVCAHTTWAVTVAAGAGLAAGFTLGALVTIAVVAILLDDGDVHIAEDVLRELGPGASARRLLEMRRKALIKVAKQLTKKA